MWRNYEEFGFLLVLLVTSVQAEECRNTKPNVVIMLMDDMGWGDLGVNGDPSHETPHLDRMAQEGMLFTDFYAGNPLCSPSRAALLTGRLPIRNGFYTTNAKARNSYVPQNMVGGISADEILLPEILSEVGYRSKIVGKWHLGHAKPEYMPLENGFDEFFGSPNVHFGPYDGKRMPNVPVFRDGRMIGRYFENIHIDRKRQVSNMTEWATNEAIEFIEKESSHQRPFFLYWTPDSLHAPTFRSKRYVGRSLKGTSYGDALIEIDDSVGRILDTIRKDECLRNNTFVFFTSDNGAALSSQNDCGSNGPLFCGKQTTFEGGFREPAIAWWPGRISTGSVTNQIATVMDLFNTVASITGATVPSDREYDSNDLSVVMFDNQLLLNASMFYYRGDTLMAVRHGHYKAHLWTFTNPIEEQHRGIDYCPGNRLPNITTNRLTSHLKSPILFHLMRDPGERFPLKKSTQEYNAAAKLLLDIARRHEASLKPAKPVLNYCDDAAMNWAPPGCEQINMCLPKPESNLKLCIWPH